MLTRANIILSKTSIRIFLCLFLIGVGLKLRAQTKDIDKLFISAINDKSYKLVSELYKNGANIDSIDTCKNADSLWLFVWSALKDEYFYGGRYLNDSTKFSRADALYLKSCQYNKKIYGVSNKQYFNSLKELSILYANYKIEYERKAIDNLQFLQKKINELFGKTNEYAVISYYLGATYGNLGLYLKSIPELIEAKNSWDKLPIDSIDLYVYRSNLTRLASFYHITGNNTKCLDMYLSAISIWRQIKSKSKYCVDTDFADALEDIIQIYVLKKDFDKAEPLLIEAFNEWKGLFSSKHPQRAVKLLHMSMFYKLKGNLIKSDSLLYESNKIKLALNNESLLSFANSIRELGNYYETANQLSISEDLYIEALKIFDNSKGFNQKNYLLLLNDLATIYLKNGSFEKSKFFFNKVLVIAKEEFSANSPEFADYLNNLGSLYLTIHDFKNAEDYFKTALSIYKTAEGNESNYYVSSLSNLASFYNSIGDYSKSNILFLEALGIIKKKKGVETSDYAYLLVKCVYSISNNDFTIAKSLMKNALNIYENTYTKKSKQYASLLTNVAFIYLTANQHNEADQLLKEALNIQTELNGNSNPDIVNTLINLGYLNFKLKKYNYSLSYYQMALELQNKYNGENNMSDDNIMSSLAILYETISDFEHSKEYYTKSISIVRKNIQNQFSFLSDKEREMYWDKSQYFLNNHLPSFVFNFYKRNPDIASIAYDNALFTKGLLLNTSFQIQNSILQSGDVELLQQWNNLRNLRKTIENYQLGIQNNNAVLQNLKNSADSLDKIITIKSQKYKQIQSDINVQWKNVQKSLKTDEASIEFVTFRYFNKADYTDSIMNCALVQKKESEYPELIPLFENRQLDSLLIKTNTQNLYAYRLTNISKAEKQFSYGKELFNLIWKPLEISLLGIKTVYYSPSGKLNSIAFAAIPVDSAQLLCDKYNLIQLTSTKELINIESSENKPGSISLFGGAQFDVDEKQFAAISTRSMSTQSSSISQFTNDTTFRSENYALNYLSGTLREVKGIDSLAQKTNLHTNYYVDTTCNESNFKYLSGKSSDVIHVATHGFYLPLEKTKQPDFKYMHLNSETQLNENWIIKNPLRRCGLAFSGANKAWRGDNIPNDYEDGILTGEEISNLNLSKTKLLVLSACQTALGDDGGSEGVFGLQRAFKLAGIQTLIVSLWEVPDTQTSQLMQLFYLNWFGGMTKHNAFTKAQNEVRKTNPNPYFWAGFVIVD